MIVEIVHGQHVEEELVGCLPFQTVSPIVSSGPWIPMIPGSNEISELGKQWEDDHPDDDTSSHSGSISRIIEKS